jgi:uncharacterized repeat protein (TIGR03803 family)
MSIHRAIAFGLAAVPWLVAAAAPAAAPDASSKPPFSVLHAFAGGNDGAQPAASLLLASDGNFYGTTAAGGPYNLGTVYRMTPSGTVTIVYAFSGSDGNDPTAPLLQGADGLLYGTTRSGGGYGDIFSMALDGSSYTPVYAFNPSSGSEPTNGLVQAADGSFYGTTWVGGDYSDGTVFRMAPGGEVTVLYSFNLQAASGFSGAFPTGVLLASDGFLYGLTFQSAQVNGCSDTAGCGAVYKMTVDGKLVWYKYLGDDVGANPMNVLVEASDGNFYGTALLGGPVDPNYCTAGCGTVFRVSTKGKLARLHAFKDSQGINPQSGLFQGSDGMLYGTTYGGAPNSACASCGTIFKLALDGTFALVHAFHGDTDGSHPLAAPVQGADGRFYGTASSGGASGRGVAYRFGQKPGSLDER